MKTKIPEQKRTHDLGVRVSEFEEATINKKAESLGMSKSEYVRFILLNAKVELSL